jgi:hypothetical protein
LEAGGVGSTGVGGEDGFSGVEVNVGGGIGVAFPPPPPQATLASTSISVAKNSFVSDLFAFIVDASIAQSVSTKNRPKAYTYWL